MARIADTSRYGMLQAQNAKRRSIVQHGMGRSDNVRQFMTSNINQQANLQVKTTEMQLRSNAQTAAKVRAEARNKLNKLA